MKKIDNEVLINLYYWGYELSSSDKPFPDWFGSEAEKIACLLGYQSFDIGIVKGEDEIIKEVYDTIK